MKRMAILALAIASAWAPTAAIAQSSASYRITDHTLNAGGHPASGTVMSSSGPVGYRVTLDSIGDGLVDTGLLGGSYVMDAGFASGYPPPGEVQQMRFSSRDTMEWHADRSGGPYNVYRDGLTDLAGLDYGECFVPDLNTTTLQDAGMPPVGDGWFYLVTAQNRLGEEGTKGLRSSGTERQGTFCP